MRKIIRTSVLLLVLACSVSAGEIGNGTPQSGKNMQEKSVTQEPETLTEITLTLLQSVLFLF
jgi:hypothetical protein